MRRLLEITLKLLALLLTVMAIAVGLLAWRLHSRPLPLAWFTPQIEQSIGAASAPFKVTIGDLALRLAKADSTPELIATDVKLFGPAGALLSTFPEVEAGLSLEALIGHHVIAISRLAAKAPILLLMRGADGSLGLQSRDAGGAGPKVPFEALLTRLLEGADPRDPVHYLEEVSFVGGWMAYRDQITGTELVGNQATLTLRRLGAELTGELDFMLQQEGGDARIELNAQFGRPSDRIGFAVDFTDLMPPEVARLVPAWPLADLRLPLRGRIEGDLGLDGDLSPLQLALTGGQGAIALPDLLPTPLPVAALELHARAGENLRELDISRWRLLGEGIEISARGKVSFAAEHPTVTAELQAQGITAEDVRSYWPPRFGRGARAWVLENVTAGRVPRLSARLQLAPVDFVTRPIRDEALDGEFQFEDVAVRYLDTMPPAVGLDGRARFTGRTLSFEVDRGRSAGIELTKGSVGITGIGIPGRESTQLEVEAMLRGPIADGLALVDHPPLWAASKLGIVPAKAAGTAVATLRIGMPLHRGPILDEEVRFAADAKFEDAALQDLRGEIDLSAGHLDLTLDRVEAALSGQVSVNGIPISVDITEPLATKGTAQRILRLRGTVDRALLARYAPDLPVTFDGQAAIDATVTETAANLWIDLAVDLKAAALEWPAIAWRKDTGTPGELRAALALPKDGPLQIKQVELDAGGLNARGSIKLDDAGTGIMAIDLRRFRLDDSDAAIRIQRSAQYGFDVAIDAKSLDLDRLLEGIERKGSNDGDAAYRVQLRANRLFLRGLALNEVNADVIHAATGWRSAEVTGQLSEGGKVQISLRPENGGHRLLVESDDAGDLLVALDQTHRVEGGKLRLNAEILQQRPRIAAHGSLAIDQFTLRDVPLLARLLTVASFTGISNLLSGKGINVDRFRLPFDLQGKELSITGGRLNGSQLGLTVKGRVHFAREQLDLEGTIVPLYAINRLLGRLPVIGDFLAGTDGIGAFAVTYQVKGPTARPEITINPLSLLAPGTIRDLISGLIGGGLEPPTVPESDK